MRKKINLRFIGITVAAISITAILMTVIFCAKMKDQVFADLEIIASLLDAENMERELPDEIRVTLIGSDGTVFYDSEVDELEMENHAGRPEVKEAEASGTGRAVRHSDTLSENVCYYAKKLPDGKVLRVGKAASSVWWGLLSILPVMIFVILVVISVCLLASHYLTVAIVRPIDRMVEDMEHIDERTIYRELVPFTRKIRSQHEELLSVVKMRQEFTANVSHELKTPLAAISGYAELMETGLAKEEDVRHFSKEIHKSANRLLNLINDILKMSRLDAGESETTEVTDLSEVVEETVATLSFQAKKENITIYSNVCAEASVHIGREPAEEVVFNLVQNAVRYNVKGGRVSVTLENEDNKVILRVKDTGIGIAEKHQKRVFERFYRVDKSRSKKLGGTGLGLAIVKHICDLSGGILTLESALGKGTCVTVVWQNSGNKGLAV